MSALRALLAPALALVPCGACALPTRAPPGSGVELAIGPHGIDDDAWEPIDPRVLGALYWTTRKEGWPCGLEFGLQYAKAKSVDNSQTDGADFFELRGGAAGAWDATSRLRLLAGAGPRLGFVTVDVPGTFNETTERGSTLGVYAHTGAYVRLAGSFGLGLDAQWSTGSDYDVLDGSADATSAELLIALHWQR